MKISQCLFFFLAPLFLVAQAQELHLPISFHEGNGPFEYALPAMKWDDTSIVNSYSQVKNIPSNLKNIRKGIIYFDVAQYLFQSYVSGKISEENFEKIKKNPMLKFDDKVLLKNEIKCYVNIISATNERNEQVCIIDANNNNDFKDDKLFIPVFDSLPDEELNRHLIKVACQRMLNGKLINDTVPLLITQDGSLLAFSVAQYATTTLNINKKSYKLAVCPLYFLNRTWKQAQLVLLSDSLKTRKASQNLIVANDGFITIGENIYKFIGVDITKNLLSLQKISRRVEFSSQVGFRAPLFKSADLFTENEISLASQKGKYIFLDFWGTWCQPCRQQLPELIKLNNAIDTSKFVLISIASSDELNNLKSFIAKENMLWPQIFSDKITEQYHVNGFPTSFLINPNGIIVARDLSMDELKGKLSELALLKDD